MSDDEVIIQVDKNSSYHVSGPVKLIDAEGNRFFVTPGEDFWLCRCGHSTTKPFCDGTGHRKSGFKSDPRPDPGE